MESSQASLTRAVELLGTPSIIDMNPIASFGPQISITLSPIIISITPDCTMYMQEPVSPLLKTTLPAVNVTFAPARWANIRMSISLPFISASPVQATYRWQRLYAKSSQPRASFASPGAMIPWPRVGRRSPGMLLAAHHGGTIMATATTIARRPVESALPAPRARIGMIIPSVNSMTEPQFNHFAPPGLGVHVARARVAGEWKQDATGIEAVATSRLVLEALQALGLRRLVLLSPYKSNQAVIDYLGATGFTVVHDVALARKALEFATVTPREWAELARMH